MTTRRLRYNWVLYGVYEGVQLPIAIAECNVKNRNPTELTQVKHRCTDLVVAALVQLRIGIYACPAEGISSQRGWEYKGAGVSSFPPQSQALVRWHLHSLNRASKLRLRRLTPVAGVPLAF